MIYDYDRLSFYLVRLVIIHVRHFVVDNLYALG